MLAAAASLYQVPKSGRAKSDFGHFRSLPMVAFDWKSMTSYWCSIFCYSIVTSGLDGTVVELYAVEVSQPYSPETN